jgi:hypothetical protein
MHLLENQSYDLNDRDLLVKTYVADNGDIRRDFRIPKETFAVILIGKDGKEKFRATEPTDIAEIYDIIDSWPNRQREVAVKSV